LAAFPPHVQSIPCKTVSHFFPASLTQLIQHANGQCQPTLGFPVAPNVNEYQIKNDNQNLWMFSVASNIGRYITNQTSARKCKGRYWSASLGVKDIQKKQYIGLSQPCTWRSIMSTYFSNWVSYCLKLCSMRSICHTIQGPTCPRGTSLWTVAKRPHKNRINSSKKP
jgi:hypothetical protein